MRWRWLNKWGLAKVMTKGITVHTFYVSAPYLPSLQSWFWHVCSVTSQENDLRGGDFQLQWMDEVSWRFFCDHPVQNVTCRCVGWQTLWDNPVQLRSSNSCLVSLFSCLLKWKWKSPNIRMFLFVAEISDTSTINSSLKVMLVNLFFSDGGGQYE